MSRRYTMGLFVRSKEKPCIKITYPLRSVSTLRIRFVTGRDKTLHKPTYTTVVA